MTSRTTRSLSLRACAAIALILLPGCDRGARNSGQAESGGTIVISATSDPDALFPPSALNMEARQATELMYEYLADVGPEMNTIGDAGFVKQLASSWEWSADSSTIVFHLNPAAKWHDGRPVTAHDVAFSYGIYTDEAVGSATASSLGDIVSVTALDSLSAAFRFLRRTPHQFYDAAAVMLILPAHLLENIPRDSMRVVTARTNPVGSNKYAFGTWTRGSSFELRAVENHYRGRARTDRLIWTIVPEYKAAVTQLLGGNADVFPTIRQETIPAILEGHRFNLVTLPGMDYVFFGFNLRDPKRRGRPHPIFASRDVRRAITMALDRQAMVKNVFDTLASVSIGPTVRAYPTTDTTLAQIPFDPAGASRILDSLGWRRSPPNGMRSKNGVRLRFTTIVPVSSLSRMRMAVLIQEQLRTAGIAMEIDQMDYSAFSERQRGRDFDAQMAAWHLGSSFGAVRETWTTRAAQQGGLNYGSYSNPRFDALVDSGVGAPTVPAARHYLSSAFRIIIDDAPAVWLYEPETLLAVSRRFRTGPMRPNAWWLGIAEWAP
jgi:peptide/nickel transport system substrate-binding protein